LRGLFFSNDRQREIKDTNAHQIAWSNLVSASPLASVSHRCFLEFLFADHQMQFPACGTFTSTIAKIVFTKKMKVHDKLKIKGTSL